MNKTLRLVLLGLCAAGLAVWGILDHLVGRILDVIATLGVAYVLVEIFRRSEP